MKNGQSYSTVSYGILYQLLEHKNIRKQNNDKNSFRLGRQRLFSYDRPFNNGDPSNDLNFGRKN
jgi:hypothetical protein